MPRGISHEGIHNATPLASSQIVPRDPAGISGTGGRQEEAVSEAGRIHFEGREEIDNHVPGFRERRCGRR
jgi:hypothetical protein